MDSLVTLTLTDYFLVTAGTKASTVISVLIGVMDVS